MLGTFIKRSSASQRVTTLANVSRSFGCQASTKIAASSRFFLSFFSSRKRNKKSDYFFREFNSRGNVDCRSLNTELASIGFAKRVNGSVSGYKSAVVVSAAENVGGKLFGIEFKIPTVGREPWSTSGSGRRLKS